MITLKKVTPGQVSTAPAAPAASPGQHFNSQIKSRKADPLSRWRLPAVLTLCLILLLPAFPTLLSAKVGGFPEPTPDPTFSFSVMPVYQFPTKVDGGGTLGVFSLYSYAEISKQLNQNLGVGLSFKYQFDNYDFSGLEDFYVPRPWKEVQQLGFSVPIYYTVNDKWQFIIIPTGQFAGEFDARFGDSLVYGGGVAVRYTFGPRVTLGAGVAGYYYLEQARVFPFLVIDLKLSDRIRVTNPFRLGPAGPAGLIVNYKLNPKWEVGFGGAYRSYRFRLDYDGPIPNGIGEYNSLPLFVRVGYSLTPAVTVDLYGGISIYNHLRVQDRDGNELYESGQNVSPLIGASISGRF